SASSLAETIAPPPPPVPTTDDAKTPFGDAQGPRQATPEAAAAPATVEPMWVPSSSPALPQMPAPAPRVRPVTGGLFSAVAALLVLVTLVLSLGIGLDLPRAVAVGLPDPGVAKEIRQTLFGDFKNWPVLIGEILWFAVSFLAVISIGVLM